MAGERTAHIQVADRGMDMSSSPLLVSSRKAPWVQNLLPGRDGRLPVRGPLHEVTDDFTASVTDMWAFERAISIVGDRAYVTDADDGTSTTWASIGDGAAPIALALTNADYAPGNRVVELSGVWYCESNRYTTMNASEAMQSKYGFALPDHIVKIDSTYVFSIYTTDNPCNMVDMIDHLNRLFVLGGGFGTGGSFAEKLYWSDIGGPTSGAAAEWQDDATGLTNEIALGTNGGALVGMAHVGRNLAILRRRSIQMLYGDTPSSFALRTEISEYGCVERSSIFEYGDGIYFRSDDGIAYFDGTSIGIVSQPIQPIINLLDDYKLSVARIGAEYLLFCFGPEDTTSTAYNFLFHVPTQSWSMLTAHTSVLPNWSGAFQRVGNSTSYAWGWDGQRLYLLDDITKPELLASGSRVPGKDHNGTSHYYIPTQLETRIMRLSSPVMNSMVSRVFLEFGNLTTDTEGAAGGLDIRAGERARDSLTNGTPLNTGAAPASSGSSYSAVGTVDSQLAGFDVYWEARQIQFMVSGPTGAAPDTDAKYHDIGDLWVEFSTTRPR